LIDTPYHLPMSNPLALPQMIEANDLRFGYHLLGDGPLLLLLHGFPDTARAWDPVMAPLAAAGYTVVAPYLRGYAPSEIPPADTTVEDLGHDVIALIDAFDAKTAVVVGHDWGGAAAYAAAALAPERIGRLVAVALPHPAGFKPKLTDYWPARHFITFKSGSAPAKFVANDFHGLRAIYKRWSPEWEMTEDDLLDSIRCLSNRDSLQAVFGYYRAAERKPSPLMRRKIDLPTVAFAGHSDGVVPLRAYREAATRFTGEYRVVELPGGHFPHREDPELFTSKLLEELAR
jgi:pimeloyl-ACP methyl ester carboxylesterase